MSSADPFFLQQQALRYAALGWRVLPLRHASKTPATTKARAWSTTDPDQVRRLWIMGSDQGIAIGPDCRQWLETFQGYGLPDTAVAISRDGHLMYLYRLPADCPCLRICVSGEYDILSTGLVTLPPSIHPVTGKPRRWLTDPETVGDLPYAPQWAVDRLTSHASRKRADMGAAAPPPPRWPAPSRPSRSLARPRTAGAAP